MLLLAVAAGVFTCSVSFGKSLKAPPGMFKDLNDGILGDAIIINGKQLFIDDYIIGELTGAEKVLNQPVKHAKNPLIVPDQPWEKNGFHSNGTVMYDEQERIFKMWYTLWLPKEQKKGPHIGGYGYATSTDGITWQKPQINKKGGQTNRIVPPKTIGFIGSSVFKDPVTMDPQRRYKMFYNEKPDGTAKTWRTSVAYSPDGIHHWTPDPNLPLIPFSDTQTHAYWDARAGRYVAYLRANAGMGRLISRIESEDFVHWSPKVTVIRPRGNLDWRFRTVMYGMRIMPYERVYIGLLSAYQGETIKPIPKEKETWTDKVETQLAFSRNGLTWLRVGKHGAIPHQELSKGHYWKTSDKRPVFIPYGEHKKAWDWGQIYAFQTALVVGDEIRIYYTGFGSRHWASYHGDPTPPPSGVGLATLRLDGFVSINAKDEGTMTTKPFVFIGDTIEVNANAAGGSIQVEALDPEDKVIEGFAKKDCTAITSDSVRHVLKWKGKADCQLIQARPIKLRFYLKKAKLYSFAPRIRYKHYIPSYD